MRVSLRLPPDPSLELFEEEDGDLSRELEWMDLGTISTEADDPPGGGGGGPPDDAREIDKLGIEPPRLELELLLLLLLLAPLLLLRLSSCFLFLLLELLERRGKLLLVLHLVAYTQSNEQTKYK